MIIPYPYDRTGAGATASGGAVLGERGVFTWLRDGRLYQRAMTVRGAFLDSAKVRSMSVLSDGTALHTTAHAGGTQTVSNGGLADGVVVNSGGRLFVSSGGTAASVSVNLYGSVTVQGGVLSGGEVNSGGTAYLSSSATADGIAVSAYGSLLCDGANNIRNCSIASGGRLVTGSGASVEHLTVHSGASFSCVGGMSATSISVQSGGILFVNSGAKCLDAEITQGARLQPYVVGNDGETVLTGSGPDGEFSVSNGTATSFTVGSGAGLQLYYYGSALGTTLTSGGSMVVSFGAVAEHNTIRPYGRLYVYSGGTARDT